MKRWTDDERREAIGLFLQLPFGRIHSRNPVIIRAAERMCRTPASVAMKVLNMASLSPELRASGRAGLANASADDRRIWNEVMLGEEEMMARLAEHAEADGLGGEESDAERPEVQTEVMRTVRQRRGQRFFRRSVLTNYDGTCCISGLRDPRLLVASHIVPWRLNARIRLSPKNGLCLSALHDRLFDIGIITVYEDGRIGVSRSFIDNITDDYSVRNIHMLQGQVIRRGRKFVPEAEYLAYHNVHVFQD